MVCAQPAGSPLPDVPRCVKWCISCHAETGVIIAQIRCERCDQSYTLDIPCPVFLACAIVGGELRFCKPCTEELAAELGIP